MASIFRLLAAVTLLGMQISFPVLGADAIRRHRLCRMNGEFSGKIRFPEVSPWLIRATAFRFKVAVKSNFNKDRRPFARVLALHRCFRSRMHATLVSSDFSRFRNTFVDKSFRTCIFFFLETSIVAEHTYRCIEIICRPIFFP